MVRRLVHEKASGVLHERVPAAEIVGTVDDIEIPVEVDRNDLADGVADQQFVDRARRRREAVVEGDIDTPPRAALGIEDLPARLGPVASGLSLITSTPASSA